MIVKIAMKSIVGVYDSCICLIETIYHYRMWKKRFQEDTNFNQIESRVNSPSLGLGFFRRFRSPTVFLKISCNGDFLLPIVVGILDQNFVVIGFVFLMNLAVSFGLCLQGNMLLRNL